MDLWDPFIWANPNLYSWLLILGLEERNCHSLWGEMCVLGQQFWSSNVGDGIFLLREGVLIYNGANSFSPLGAWGITPRVSFPPSFFGWCLLEVFVDVDVVPMGCLFITMKSEGTFLSPGHRSTECKQAQCYITVEGEYLILMVTLLHC